MAMAMTLTLTMSMTMSMTTSSFGSASVPPVAIASTSSPAVSRSVISSKERSSHLLHRRALLSLASVVSSLHILRTNPALASSVSKRVRLKDVENPKLQEALRAAVAGDLETAEKIFSELILEDPKSASVWSNRGSVRLSLRLYEEALSDLNKAVELAPEAPVPLLNRAIALEALGRFEEAINDCKSAIENDPEEYAAWFNLGNVDTRINKFDDALVAYERASLLAPGIAGYRLKEALTLFQLEKPEDARKLMQGLVRKYPNYAEAHAALAAVLWSEGEVSKAEGQFSEATRREPLYRDIRWVSAELQWPPNMIKAMENFLSLM